MVTVLEPRDFKYDKCLLKHYVRINGWLPNCKARKKAINQGLAQTRQRRLRYFTFCAIGAIDVLMLDVANIVGRSASGKFDNVVFFDHSLDAVIETQKRIPGAIGFSGKFTDVVLAGGPDANTPEDSDVLAPPANSQDTRATREHQRTLDQRRKFIERFPFDVVNLDLEEYAFKPNDQFPGKVINALRKIFLWQKRPLQNGADGTANTYIDGFTLMFTTRVGPANMTDEYKAMLRECLARNVEERPALLGLLKTRVGVDGIASLEATKFDEFFKLGIRKLLASLLLEADWYVDATEGIKTFEFQRRFDGGSYTMLHFVMDVKRQHPPLDRRAPNSRYAEGALADYSSVVEKLFKLPDFQVTDALAEAAILKPTLGQIRSRRKKYYPDEPA